MKGKMMMNRAEKRCIDRFKATIFLLDQEEVDAIGGAIPMTQELFDSILDKCMGQRVDEFFYEMLSRYPEFLKESAKSEEAELEGQPASPDRHISSSEEDEALWQSICAKIKNAYRNNPGL